MLRALTFADLVKPMMCNAPPTRSRRVDRIVRLIERECSARRDDAFADIGGGSAPSTSCIEIDASGGAVTRPVPVAKKEKSGDDGDDGPGLGLLIAKLAERLEAIARPALPVDIDLWDADTIGQYLKRSTSLVRERVVCQPSFPAAIRLPNGNGQRMHPLWKAREVIDWAESHREHKTA
jgi:hypothetical protein